MKKILLISANTETINMPVLPLGLAFVNAALLAQEFETIYSWVEGRSNCF